MVLYIPYLMSMFYMTIASRNDGAGYANTISLDLGIEDTISMALLKCDVSSKK